MDNDLLKETIGKIGLDIHDLVKSDKSTNLSGDVKQIILNSDLPFEGENLKAFISIHQNLAKILRDDII